MDRRVLAVSTGLLVAVLLAFVTSAGGVSLWTEPSIDLTPSGPAAGDPLAPLDTPPPVEPDPRETTTIELPAIVEWVLVAIGVALLVVTIGALLLYSWRNRPRLRWRRPDPDDTSFEALPDVAGAVIDDAAAQRAELRRGAPRNAIVQCWLRLERAVERAGLERDDADTPAEFTARVLRHYAVDPGAIDALSTLYREARFSTHALGEPEREAAVAALDALHRSLQTASSVDTGAAGAAVGG
jgi:hypothetical protein